jgi:hypothetical protein
MLIKQADDQTAVIAALEQASKSSGPGAKRSGEALRIRKAGLKGEAESAYLIDFEFAQSRNWAVIHDLRIEHNGRTAQIDHLLINRWMDFYVLESKHFHAGLKITEDGEFLRWNAHRRTYEGMASPLEQNDRHIAVLRDAVEKIELPVRLGLRIPPSFSSLILVSPTARIDRPKRFDSSRVIKADQLKKRLWKDIDEENPLLGLIKTAAKIVSSDTIEYVARQLAEMHCPLHRAKPPRPDTAMPPKQPSARPKVDGASRAKSGEAGPTCKACGASRGAVLYGKYGYYFKCGGCQANTAIRCTCQPGHQPRLRKQGLCFYRDCPGCGTSALFHKNTAEELAR